MTLQLASGDDPVVPTLGWEIIPGVRTLTRFFFDFQLGWGETVTKNVFGAFVINGLGVDITFAPQTGAGPTSTGSSPSSPPRAHREP